MADISVMVNGEVNIMKMQSDTGCMLVDLKSEIPVGITGEMIPYERCRLYLHGPASSLRAFAEKLLAALPDEISADPFDNCLHYDFGVVGEIDPNLRVLMDEPPQSPELPAGAYTHRTVTLVSPCASIDLGEKR